MGEPFKLKHRGGESVVLRGNPFAWTRRWDEFGCCSSSLLFDPAEQTRLVVGRLPGKRQKMWEAHAASFVLHLPPRKGARNELIVLRFLVDDAEASTRHRYENLLIQDFDGNFRFRVPRQFHGCRAYQ